MSITPVQKPLQPLLGGMGNIPGLRITGDRRAREMISPPAFNQQIYCSWWGDFAGPKSSSAIGYSFREKILKEPR
jgi:hypothetical protein